MINCSISIFSFDNLESLDYVYSSLDGIFEILSLICWDGAFPLFHPAKLGECKQARERLSNISRKNKLCGKKNCNPYLTVNHDKVEPSKKLGSSL